MGRPLLDLAWSAPWPCKGDSQSSRTRHDGAVDRPLPATGPPVLGVTRRGLRVEGGQGGPHHALAPDMVVAPDVACLISFLLATTLHVAGALPVPRASAITPCFHPFASACLCVLFGRAAASALLFALSLAWAPFGLGSPGPASCVSFQQLKKERLNLQSMRARLN